ncbi:hypothetical protein [Eubacterium coprostanoligenes]|uniref:Uncharacterized protein n=1 Tax=Eubacterium coprostanoligenes TaxID=290054 RepID=A0A1T4K7S2_9FIRM|nr:hypothetical protein [Eubacterium coprostanoligenes]SJZ38456.1 hypothetical protein SAMN02745114_00319 [Eubacterium coprostanoligenes]
MPRSYRQISQYEKEIIELYNQGITKSFIMIKYLDIKTPLWYVVVLQGSDFMSTLQELWYGNIRPNEDKIISDEEKRLIELIARHHETLSSSLKK